MPGKKKTRPLITTALVVCTLCAGGFAEDSTHNKIVIRSDETLFTTFAYITIGTFNDVDRGKMTPLKEFVWRQLNASLDPAYKERIRKDIAPLAADRMFEYNATMLALNCTPPPEIRFLKEELEAHVLGRGGDIERAMQNFQGLENMPTLLTEFYEKAAIGGLYEDCRPWHDDAVSKYEEKVTSLLGRALDYLGMSREEMSTTYERIVIIPNLIGPRGSAMGPVWKGVKYDVYSPWEGISWSPHEFIHDMVAPLTKSRKHETLILRIVESVLEDIQGTPAAQYYPDPVDFFDECLVRTIDHIVTRDWKNPLERERIRTALTDHAGRGFVLCLPMLEILAGYESAGGTFAEFFPDFLKALSGG